MSTKSRLPMLMAVVAALASLASAPAFAQRDGDRERGWDRDRPRAERWHRDGHDPEGWRDRWTLLGTEQVGFRAESDVIKIGRYEGRFRNIALVVRRGEVYVHALRVWFANGERQDIAIRDEYSAGGRTGPLDLEGDDRVIDRIELLYKAVEGGPRGEAAIVEVWGEHGREHHHRRRDDGYAVAPTPPPAPHYQQWVQLGCQKVAFLGDHDEVPVGREAGRYSALKLTIAGTKVDVHRMRVIYANGEQEDLPVQAEIKSGAESAPLPLHGGHRSIERIILDYAAKPSFKGEATACVLGHPH